MKEQLSKKKPDCYVRQDPERSHIVHLSKTPNGPTHCKMKPSDRLITLGPDKKFLTRDNVCSNCNGVVKKRMKNQFPMVVNHGK
jgi:hypothetical protein